MNTKEEMKLRLDQLAKLDELLIDIHTLNRGSDFLGKLQKCIDVAGELRKTDFDNNIKSFYRWLEDLVYDYNDLVNPSEDEQELEET